MLDDIAHPGLQVFLGDVLDPVAVEQAVSGRDAVLCAIGAGAGRTTLREDGTRNIIRAMEKAGVRRLICQSSMGVGDSRANLGFLTKYVIVPVFLRHAFADHERQEAVVKESTLDWTIVRPPHLKDGLHTGTYRHGFPTTDTGILGNLQKVNDTTPPDFTYVNANWPIFGRFVRPSGDRGVYQQNRPLSDIRSRVT